MTDSEKIALLKEYLRQASIELEQQRELGKTNNLTECYLDGRLDQIEDIQEVLNRS